MTDPVPLQQTFDRVALHLRRQGRPSVREIDSLLLPVGPPTALKEALDEPAAYSGAYRGVDGCSCAAGCLIPDSLYAPSMEGRGVSEDQPAGIVLTSLGHDIPLVQQLQLLHDGLISTWSAVGISVGLREVADQFGLLREAATGPL